MQPILHTPRLELRPAKPDDLEFLWSLWTDADVRRYLWDDREITRAEAASAVADAAQGASSGLGLWIVKSAEQSSSIAAAPRLIGCAGLLPTSVAAEFDARLRGLIEPLIAITPPAWRCGYAREALATLLTYATGTLGHARVAGVADVPNIASDRLLRSVGFRVLGEVPGPRYALRTYVWEAPNSSD